MMAEPCFVINIAATSLSVAITTDTMTLVNTTTTGTRTLAQNAMATLVKVGATNELALTAEALYTCVYTKSGFWIVTGLTKLGAAQAALVPDAR